MEHHAADSPVGTGHGRMRGYQNLEYHAFLRFPVSASEAETWGHEPACGSGSILLRCTVSSCQMHSPSMHLSCELRPWQRPVGLGCLTSKTKTPVSIQSFKCHLYPEKISSILDLTAPLSHTFTSSSGTPKDIGYCQNGFVFGSVKVCQPGESVG